MTLIPTTFGVLSICVAIWHEWIWYRRYCGGVRLTGKIVDELEDSDGNSTRFEIEFIFNESVVRFTSNYSGSSLARVGDDVEVMFNPKSNDAERLSWSNRWIFTIGPSVLGSLFIFAGVNK